MATRLAYVPMGRLDEYISRPDAECLAITYPATVFGDYVVCKYRSRKALESFCRVGSQHHALVKTPVHPSMLVNPNTQRPIQP